MHPDQQLELGTPASPEGGVALSAGEGQGKVASGFRFIGGRLVALVLTLLIASVLIYGAVYLAPGTPESFLAGGKPVSPADLAKLQEQYHLNDSFPAAYVQWLGGVVQGDLGISVVNKSSVTSLLGPRIGTTVFLCTYAAILILGFGIGLGLLAGLVPRLSGPIVGGTTLAMSIPAFVTAILLVLVFSVWLGIFPSVGSGEGFFGRLQHLTLPAIAMALALVAYVSRITRVAIRQELSMEHVETATSRGLPRSWIVRKHVIRNAAIPISTVAGISFAAMIGIDAVVEVAFSLNGLGAYLVQSVTNKDFAVVQAICLIFVAVFVVINTAVDIFYTWADPRLSATEANR